jgi:phosphatidylinositol alpha-1,6-mannosyltransferase
MWIGIFPELSGIGGIQQVGRHTGAVLLRRSEALDLPCQLLGLNDARGPGSFRVGTQEYAFRGFGRNNIALISYLLRAAPRLDALYLGHVNLAPVGFFLQLIRPRIEYWIVAHGVEVWQPLPLLRRLGLRNVRGALSVSAYTADQMVRAQKLDPGKVFLLPPALDPSFMDSSGDPKELGLPAGAKVLLTVGRLISSEPGKGVDSVIRVFSEILKAVPDVYYVVIGGGDLQPRLEEMAEESKVGGRIRFIGKLELRQLTEYYLRSDIFVMPSRQEGFGIVFLEAMALGKPVVAGNHGGIPEIVQDGVTGFLVDPDDPPALALRLIELLQDEPLRRKMGDAGRRRVEENYTFSRFEERLIHIMNTATDA